MVAGNRHISIWGDLKIPALTSYIGELLEIEEVSNKVTGHSSL